MERPNRYARTPLKVLHEEGREEQKRSSNLQGSPNSKTRKARVVNHRTRAIRERRKKAEKI